jgi:hypothetical protein
MVWSFGLVWYFLVWFGGLVCSVLPWSGLAWADLVWSGLAWSSLARQSCPERAYMSRMVVLYKQDLIRPKLSCFSGGDRSIVRFV